MVILEKFGLKSLAPLLMALGVVVPPSVPRMASRQQNDLLNPDNSVEKFAVCEDVRDFHVSECSCSAVAVFFYTWTMQCGEVLAAYMFVGAALCMRMTLLLMSVAHWLMGWDGKTRTVLFVYVSVGIVSAHDIGSLCSVCCVPCARCDVWLNVSDARSPSPCDIGLLLEHGWCDVGLRWMLHPVLRCKAHGLHRSGQQIKARTGSVKVPQRTCHYPFSSGGVMLRWPACSSAGRWEYEVLQSSVSRPQCACHPWFGDDQHPGGLGLPILTCGFCLTGSCASAGLRMWQQQQSFTGCSHVFPLVTILSSCTVL